MVSTTGPVYKSLSVDFWRLFKLIQLFELSKLFLERFLDEFFSHRPSGHSHPEAPDNCHAFPAFCCTLGGTIHFGRRGRLVHHPVG